MGGRSGGGIGIERRGGRWVVTTDRGVISAPVY